MFRSFYLAGFECATGYNMHGEWIDQVAATQHDRHVDEDYARLAEVDIQAVREAVRWPLVDRGGRYDFSSVAPFVRAAARHGFDVVWDLFHYGYPDDLDPFSPEFCERFAAYCRAVARFLRARLPGPHFFTPINEPSYFAWIGGEVGRFAPHQRGRGFELKVNLARACLQGIAAIRAACPDARIVNVDPLCRVVPAPEAGVEDRVHARRFNEEYVFQLWDMLSGRMLPELGGHPGCLDVVGLNYYWTNQWELGREGTPLGDDDRRRVPLGALVRQVWERYRAPVVITETSALGEARGPWIRELSAMAEELLADGVGLGGICLYPILGMPEWHARDQWSRMGLWDLEHDQEVLARRVCAPMLEALRAAQVRGPAPAPGPPRTFSLARTGSVPLVVEGVLATRAADPRGGWELRLVRCGRPYRLWVASVAVSAGGETIRHVATAAELPMLLDVLLWSPPTAIARAHGAARDPPPEGDVSWRRAVERLGEAPELGVRAAPA
jgi:hypothetical protein